MRLFDSMPQSLLESWKRELESGDPGWERTLRKRIEAFLDSGYGECLLGQEPIATMVRDSLFYHDEKKYKLLAWVIMPNHMHLLLNQAPGVELEEITHSIKSYTAHEANKLLDRKGVFWQDECFDRFIRDHDHFRNVIRYIEMNPVKAGLCNQPGDWRFSSAFERSR